MLSRNIFTVIIFSLSIQIVQTQESLKVISGEESNNNWVLFANADKALYNHLANEAMDLLDQRSTVVHEFDTEFDWLQRQDNLKKILLDIVGPFPDKTPLNPIVTGIVEKDDFRIEHIVYLSQPDFFVTSSLFIPSGSSGQIFPAVIYLSGHTNESYRSSTYQHVILNLVNKGFIVFAVDPIGQGERIEYDYSENGQSSARGPTGGHSYPGGQAFLTGSSLARYMIWDGIRAVDYLHTRDEVDSSRIGVTGRSGGGTQSAYLAAFDHRLKAAAPESYITNFTRILQAIGPQDAEQNLFHGIKNGIDHADLLTVRAPKPLLTIATTNDYFSIQGFRETVEEVKDVYELLNQIDNFSYSVDIGGHASTKKNREAMYRFFQMHLENPGNSTDVETELLNEEELRVTDRGRVSESLGGETVFSLNRKEAEKNLAKLNESRSDIGDHLKRVKIGAVERSGFREPARIEEPVFTGKFKREGYAIEKYFLKGEGDYAIPYLLFIPDYSNGKSILYLHHEDKQAEAHEEGEIIRFVKKGFTVLAPDLPGVGEMGSENSLQKEWYTSIQIGRSITGIQAGDVVRLAMALKKAAGSEEIYAVSKKQMVSTLLHAAAFDSSITRVALLEPYSSYSSIVLNRFYNPEFLHSSVAGALTAYDLPDLAALLAPRKLLMYRVTDAYGADVSVSHLEDEFAIIMKAYEQKDAGHQFILSQDSEGKGLFPLIEEFFE